MPRYAITVTDELINAQLAHVASFHTDYPDGAVGKLGDDGMDAFYGSVRLLAELTEYRWTVGPNFDDLAVGDEFNPIDDPFTVDPGDYSVESFTDELVDELTANGFDPDEL